MFSGNVLFGKEILQSSNKELANIFLIYLVILIVGIALHRIVHKRQIRAMVKSDIVEIIIYGITSGLISYYFLQSFSLFSSYGWTSVFLLGTLFFFLLTHIVDFYQKYSLSYFRNFFKNDGSLIFPIPLAIKGEGKIRPKALPFSFKKRLGQFISSLAKQGWRNFLNLLLLLLARVVVLLGILISVVAVIIFVTTFISLQVKNYLDYNRKLRENLTIMQVRPTNTTIGEKVVMEGYNFGWRFSKNDELMSEYGPIIVELWKDNEITFIVPLHWKEGMVDVWIERIKGSLPDAPIIKSNKVGLNILNRWSFYPEENELESKSIVSYFSRGIKRLKRTLLLKNNILNRFLP